MDVPPHRSHPTSESDLAEVGLGTRLTVEGEHPAAAAPEPSPGVAGGLARGQPADPAGGLARGRPHDPVVVRAQVQAAGVTTRYARVGCGPPLVLLDLAGDAEAHPLVRALGARLRVIVPERWSAPGLDGGSHPPRPLTTWLGPLLDGLGLPRVSLLAAGELAVPALAFALVESARVERLVLLEGGAVDLSAPVEALVGRLEPARPDLLLLDATAGAAGTPALEAILSFLCGDVPGAIGQVQRA